MPTLKILAQYRENIVDAMVWLAQLEPMYFTLFCIIYVSLGLFVLGGSMLWN